MAHRHKNRDTENKLQETELAVSLKDPSACTKAHLQVRTQSYPTYPAESTLYITEIPAAALTALELRLPKALGINK